MFQYKKNNQRPLNLILMNREIILSSMVWVASAAVSLEAAVPSDLKSTPIVNPLGLSLNQYFLSWKTDKGQTAYRILVASDLESWITCEEGLLRLGKRKNDLNKVHFVRVRASKIEP